MAPSRIQNPGYLGPAQWKTDMKHLRSPLRKHTLKSLAYMVTDCRPFYTSSIPSSLRSSLERDSSSGTMLSAAAPPSTRPFRL